MGRVRVLHVYSGNLRGGAEKALVTLAALRDRCPEMEPEFAVCFEGQLTDDLRATGVAVHILGKVRLRHPWAVQRVRSRLNQLLKTAPGFDVVITHSAWLHAVFGPAVRAGGVPLCFWARDAFHHLTLIDRLAARTKPDQILANSQFTLGTVPLLFPGVPAAAVYNPLAPQPPLDRDAVRQELRRTIGCSPETTVILTDARFEKWKGHTLLLEALSLLKSGDWQAWIAGEPQRPFERQYFSRLQAMTQQLRLGDRVRWLGHRKDIPDLLSAADLHCQPNTGPEPFGNVFIEALQAGVPVVTTRLGAAPEIIDQTVSVEQTASSVIRLAAPGCGDGSEQYFGGVTLG